MWFADIVSDAWWLISHLFLNLGMILIVPVVLLAQGPWSILAGGELNVNIPVHTIVPWLYWALFAGLGATYLSEAIRLFTNPRKTKPHNWGRWNSLLNRWLGFTGIFVSIVLVHFGIEATSFDYWSRSSWIPEFVKIPIAVVFSSFVIVYIFCLVFGLATFLSYFVPRFIWSLFHKNQPTKEAAWMLVPLFYGLLMVITAFAGIFWEEDQMASRFGKLHAAIKNTCIVDPRREHCPQKLEDLRIVEEAEYDRVEAETQMFYTYDPATNTYTFIVRHEPHRAVVFDQRLIPSDGKDFREVWVTQTGQDKMWGSLPFEGEWYLPEWEIY